MIPSVESVGSYGKNDFIDKRHFLVCDCCYWCSSYLPDLENENDEYIDNCPMCNEKIKTMFISEDKSQKLDAKHIQNIMTESENWVI